MILKPKAIAWAKRLIELAIDQEGKYLPGANYELSGRQLLEAIACGYSAGQADANPKAIRLLKDAKWTIGEELEAAGPDEVKQHVTLRAHSRVYDKIAAFLDQPKEETKKS